MYEKKENLQDYQQSLVIHALDLQVKDFYLLIYQPFVEHPNMYQPKRNSTFYNPADPQKENFVEQSCLSIEPVLLNPQLLLALLLFQL